MMDLWQSVVSAARDHESLRDFENMNKLARGTLQLMSAAKQYQGTMDALRLSGAFLYL